MTLRKWTLMSILSSLFSLSACTTQYYPPGPAVAPPAMSKEHWTTADQLQLPLRSWVPKDKPPRAVILAIHGINDYSSFFENAGVRLAEKGIASYAYDQRGFGEAPHWGYWAGGQNLAQDVRTAAGLAAARHPGVPLYLLGESMGGGIVLVAATGEPLPPEMKGVILLAPAVWSRETMNVFLRSLLWMVYNVTPGLQLTGDGLRLRASDNNEILRKMFHDPLITKAMRVDVLHGVTDLMDDATAAAPLLHCPTLVLYGAKDEIIPAKSLWKAVASLPDRASGKQRAGFYPNGYHMLTRDLQANVVIDDIAAWIAHPELPLPSGADRLAQEEMAQQDP